jgi:adenosine kinase
MSESPAPQIAVMGALAYDQIAKTDKVFGPEGPGLNCKVTAQQEFFGGCAGNIAYGLGLQQVPTIVVSSAGGEDFRRYAQHLNLDLSGILVVSGAQCARANIITDPNGQQFTAFAPGPSIDPETWQVHLRNQPLQSVSIFVCAPFPANLMALALAESRQRNPDALNVWLPGQYADNLHSHDLEQSAALSDVIIGNSHEITHIRRTAPQCLAGKVTIETNGPRPVRALLPDGSQRTLPVPAAPKHLDPTGCGDAFVAGILPEMLNALKTEGRSQWHTAINGIIRAGNRHAARCLGRQGSQTYNLSIKS